MIKFVKDYVYTENIDINENEIYKNSIKKICKKVSNQNKLIFKIDLTIVKDIDTLLSKVVAIYNYALKEKIAIGEKTDDSNIVAYVISKEEDKEKIIKLFKVLEMNDLYKEYEYMYDEACEELDKKFKENDYCDFKDDKCI